MQTIIIKLGNNKAVSQSQLLKTYKQLVFMSLCDARIKKEPERFYNYCIDCLNILGYQFIKENEITFKTAMNEIYNTISIFENELLI